MSKNRAPQESTAPRVLTCGLIMPISAIDGCDANHWSEVKQILIEAVSSISEPTFETKLVSDEGDVGVIHKRIVQNIFTSDFVICDVSAKNPNVMFELGLRLAFDKPTILVKDDSTGYSFDTSVIEHLEYPRSLRFSQINIFKDKLRDKLLNTYKASQEKSHVTFLKSFGDYTAPTLDQKEVTFEQEMLDRMADMQRQLARVNNVDRDRLYPERVILRGLRPRTNDVRFDDNVSLEILQNALYNAIDAYENLIGQSIPIEDSTALKHALPQIRAITNANLPTPVTMSDEFIAASIQNRKFGVLR